MIKDKELQLIIDEYKKINYVPSDFKPVEDLLVDALEELKERRECELRPATKFLSNTIGEQLTQIQQEFKEIEAELRYEHFNKDRAIEELVDLQTACETMLVILGLDENQRMEARRKVIQKNMKRGYYNEK